jgi:uncharacterized protein YbaR (Trm112 family)
MSVHPELIALVRCPKCHGPLVLRAFGDGFECGACRLLYPVVDDIPQLLLDEARPLDVTRPIGA